MVKPADVLPHDGSEAFVANAEGLTRRGYDEAHDLEVAQNDGSGSDDDEVDGLLLHLG